MPPRRTTELAKERALDRLARRLASGTPLPGADREAPVLLTGVDTVCRHIEPYHTDPLILEYAALLAYCESGVHGFRFTQARHHAGYEELPTGRTLSGVHSVIEQAFCNDVNVVPALDIGRALASYVPDDAPDVGRTRGRKGGVATDRAFREFLRNPAKPIRDRTAATILSRVQQDKRHMEWELVAAQVPCLSRAEGAASQADLVFLDLHTSPPTLVMAELKTGFVHTFDNQHGQTFRGVLRDIVDTPLIRAALQVTLCRDWLAQTTGIFIARTAVIHAATPSSDPVVYQLDEQPRMAFLKERNAEIHQQVMNRTLMNQL
jgi:hypothetical protein